MEDGLSSVAILMNFGCLQHRPSELRDEDSETALRETRLGRRSADGAAFPGAWHPKALCARGGGANRRASPDRLDSSLVLIAGRAGG